MTLEDLKKIAEAATSGPYRIDDGIIQYEHSDYDYPDEKYWSDLGVWKTTRGTIKFWPSDAKYIATFYPELILALLEECLAARELLSVATIATHKEYAPSYYAAREATDKILGEL